LHTWLSCYSHGTAGSQLLLQFIQQSRKGKKEVWATTQKFKQIVKSSREATDIYGQCVALIKRKGVKGKLPENIDYTTIDQINMYYQRANVNEIQDKKVDASCTVLYDNTTECNQIFLLRNLDTYFKMFNTDEVIPLPLAIRNKLLNRARKIVKLQS